MKDITLIVFIVISSLLYATILPAQENARKEVLIIGTMHKVPNIVKNSYRPLLKKAKAYAPEAIYVETPQPTDTLSMQHTYPKFVAMVDSLRNVWELDTEDLTNASRKPLDQMTTGDFETIKKQYILEGDHANSQYFQYLEKYGLEGSPNPTQEEDGDLTAKLAIHLGLKELRSMDNQWYRPDYHQAWAACNKADRQDGGIEDLKKAYRGLKFSEIMAGLTRRVGMYVNSPKITRKYHIINSFRYRQTECEPCTEGRELWDARNREMARNIGNQIRSNTQTKSVVIVGAGHVVGLREVLEREYPDIEVKLLR